MNGRYDREVARNQRPAGRTERSPDRPTERPAGATERPTGRTGRRAEYAEATRVAIATAARELFMQQGYFGTTVDDIATAARVAPATVYAVGGGKQGLLKSVIESATTAPEVGEAYSYIGTFDDPQALIRFIVQATRARFEKWSGIMRVVIATAPHDPSAAEGLELARRGLHGALSRTADRLSELGALRAGMDAGEATDVLWFYLSNAAYFSLTDDNGWSLDRAETWLADSLQPALLRTNAKQQ